MVGDGSDGVLLSGSLFVWGMRRWNGPITDALFSLGWPNPATPPI